MVRSVFGYVAAKSRFVVRQQVVEICHRRNKWLAYLDWCNQFYFAADRKTALRIASHDLIRKTRVGVFAVDDSGFVQALCGCVQRNPPTLYAHRTELLLDMVFRLSPYEMSGRLRKNSCFFPNDYFQ